MENAYDLLESAVTQAKAVMSASDRHAEQFARLLEGRLRHVSTYRLKELKRELRSFNMHTGRWAK